MSLDEIDAARDKAAAFDDDTAGGDVVVWRENWPAVQVFRRCQWTTSRITGMASSRTVFEHIAATEIESVCNLLCIPAAARMEVLDGVRVMEATARPLLNR